ncbi:ABC transporter permease [Variovorax sp. M-6]|uniref:ABC transporter permease n=1 Tax=Variovorax sp. M-6 TaxID=3233041 RepID=UPI003F98040D
MNFYAWLGAVETGLIFGFVALGTYLTFRLLKFPDITVEGSFPLGGAVAAALIVAGLNPYLATLVAFAAGMLAGSITAFLNVRLKILHILSGILTSVALYSINMRVMGRPNVPLLGVDTVFTPLETHFPGSALAMPIALAAACLVVILILNRFLVSEMGLALRATGVNERMSAAYGIPTGRMKWLGLALANGLSALGGALFAQMQGASDVNMGVGVVVIGFAAVIGGTVLIKRSAVHWATFSVLLGAVLYRLAVALALGVDSIGLTPSDLNLVTAALVALALVAPGAGLMARRRRTAA